MRGVKIVLSLVLCLAAIWSMSKVVDHYKLPDYYVVIVTLPFAVIYLYQCFSLFRMKCPYCSESIFGPMYGGKVETLFKNVNFRRCNKCGRELWTKK
jgi:hypothetical protein